MRVGIATSFACGVGIWKRLADEGCEVKVWRGSYKSGPALLTSHRLVGEGIVPLCDSWSELLAWCKAGTGPTFMLFDSSGLGKLADEARAAGVLTVGGGSFCDRLEQDRQFGRALAERAGNKSPGVIEFNSLSETIAFAKSGALDRPVYWKTDTYIDGDTTHSAETPDELVEYLTWIKTRARDGISNVLEEKLDGFALSTARWWNGRAWVGAFEGTLERKKFLAGDIGPSTGCSLNAVFLYGDENPQMAKALHWDRFASEFIKREAPPGLYDVNSIVSDGKAFFLEWTPRFGWDSEGVSHLLYDDFAAWLWQIASGQGNEEGHTDEIGFGLRLTVAPAPFEHLDRDHKNSPVGVPIRGDVGDLWSEGFVAYEVMKDEHGYAVASAEGLVGVATALGDSAQALAEEAMDFTKKLRIPGLQYRNDAGDAINEDAQKTVDEGFTDLPEGLLD